MSTLRRAAVVAEHTRLDLEAGFASCEAERAQLQNLNEVLERKVQQLTGFMNQIEGHNVTTSIAFTAKALNIILDAHDMRRAEELVRFENHIRDCLQQEAEHCRALITQEKRHVVAQQQSQEERLQLFYEAQEMQALVAELQSDVQAARALPGQLRMRFIYASQCALDRWAADVAIQLEDGNNPFEAYCPVCIDGAESNLLHHPETGGFITVDQAEAVKMTLEDETQARLVAVRAESENRFVLAVRAAGEMDQILFGVESPPASASGTRAKRRPQQLVVGQADRVPAVHQGGFVPTQPLASPAHRNEGHRAPAHSPRSRADAGHKELLANTEAQSEASARVRQQAPQAPPKPSFATQQAQQADAHAAAKAQMAALLAEADDAPPTQQAQAAAYAQAYSLAHARIQADAATAAAVPGTPASSPDAAPAALPSIAPSLPAAHAAAPSQQPRTQLPSIVPAPAPVVQAQSSAQLQAQVQAHAQAQAEAYATVQAQSQAIAVAQLQVQEKVKAHLEAQTHIEEQTAALAQAKSEAAAQTPEEQAVSYADVQGQTHAIALAQANAQAQGQSLALAQAQVEGLQAQAHAYAQAQAQSHAMALMHAQAQAHSPPAGAPPAMAYLQLSQAHPLQAQAQPPPKAQVQPDALAQTQALAQAVEQQPAVNYAHYAAAVALGQTGPLSPGTAAVEDARAATTEAARLGSAGSRGSPLLSSSDSCLLADLPAVQSIIPTQAADFGDARPTALRLGSATLARVSSCASPSSGESSGYMCGEDSTFDFGVSAPDSPVLDALQVKPNWWWHPEALPKPLSGSLADTGAKSAGSDLLTGLDEISWLLTRVASTQQDRLQVVATTIMASNRLQAITAAAKGERNSVAAVAHAFGAAQPGGTPGSTAFRLRTPNTRPGGHAGGENNVVSAAALHKIQGRSDSVQQRRLAFFCNLDSDYQHNYIICVDRSASMATGDRWEQAAQATAYLAPYVTMCDPDGITLFFFDSNWKRFDHLQDEEQVLQIFEQNRPSKGSTNLTGVLQEALREHFSTFKECQKRTTILVITDGQPNNQVTTTRAVVDAANKLKSPGELSISFIQIGNDAGATRFLKHLDDNLKSKCKYNIVDTLKASQMNNLSFQEVVQLSLRRQY